MSDNGDSVDMKRKPRSHAGFYAVDSAADISVSYIGGWLVNTIYRRLFFAVLMGMFTYGSWAEESKTIVECFGMIVCPVLTIIGGIVAFNAIWLLVKRIPALEVSRKGIRYHHLLQGTQRIFWDEIEAFELRRYWDSRRGSRTMLLIRPNAAAKSQMIKVRTGELNIDYDSLVKSLVKYSQAVDSDRAGKPVVDKR